ncbi:MAG: addiction module protein [Nannocystaceae bacterium]
MALPSLEREELVGALGSSLESESLSPQWQEEIARRLQKIEEHLLSLRANHAR